ncbi:MAG: alpha/beta fold hydrolase [Anaerolineae bacterium]|nr:alpha/beta fold hydrolase [Anaerolineae bacterium]
MSRVLRTLLRLVVGWGVVQAIWVAIQLLNSNVYRSLNAPVNQAPKGRWAEQATETDQWTRISKIEDGIEWISYMPKQRKHATPILMQHGMWHGAWCWQTWQELLATWGWESHAISLPGHGASPEQRPIRACTLDYYLAFIRDAVEKLPTKPILMGHSMGGALAQWYLRYVGDLPAVVLVAPWALAGGFPDSALAFVQTDPVGILLTMLTYKAEYVRNPQAAARVLLGPGAMITPQDLHARLGPESALVMIQHALPWQIPPTLNTPMLYLGGEIDAVIPEHAGRRAAAAYNADYVMVEQAAHNLMMEHNYRETAETICRWLEQQLLQ